MFEPGLILSALVSCVGAIVWAIRVEGKVNGHDRLFEERDRLTVERDKNLSDRHKDLSDRLDRIERKIDSGFNGFTGSKH
jgi:hypothetical protein